MPQNLCEASATLRVSGESARNFKKAERGHVIPLAGFLQWGYRHKPGDYVFHMEFILYTSFWDIGIYGNFHLNSDVAANGIRGL